MPWSEFGTLFGSPARKIDWGRTRFDASLPLLDCGSGTGAGVVALAEAFPGSRILAVEPDPHMRPVLMHRVVTAGLAERVTVYPATLDQVRITGPLGGVVATGFLYFLDPGNRNRAWELFANHVVPGSGVVLEEASAPDPSDAEPERLLATRHLGALRYERWFSQRPAGDGSVVFTNTFRVWDADCQVHEDRDTCRSWPLTNERTIAESRATGAFEVEELDDRHLIARRKA